MRFVKQLSAVLGVTVLLSAAQLFGANLPVVAGKNDPVVPGQWHSNLAAAKAYAIDNNLPLLVVGGSPSCPYCTQFDDMLTSPTFKEYLENSGLVLVFENSKDKTDIQLWIGWAGELPPLRITWWQDGVMTHNETWRRPNSGAKTSNAKNQAIVLARLQDYVARNTPGFDPSSAGADLSKDKYDSGNDERDGAVELTWGDQAQSVSLRLNKTEDGTYADTNDWFKVQVQSNATYKVWTTGGDVSLTVEGYTPDADNKFETTVAGEVYILITRLDPAVAVPSYNLHWQSFAPGKIEFAPSTIKEREDAKKVALTVKRTGGTTGAVKVNVSLDDKTGKAGTLSPTTLTWADGNKADKTVTVTLIRKNKAWEGNETFTVNLEQTEGEALMGDPAIVTLEEVDAMKTDAGSYTGCVEDHPGVVTLSVSSAGKISGKWLTEEGSYTLKKANFKDMTNIVDDVSGVTSQVANVSGELVRGRNTPLPVSLDIDLSSGVATGTVGTGDNAKNVILYRNNWATPQDKALLAPMVGYYTAAFPVDVPDPSEFSFAGSGYATITVAAKGTFKASGKLGDGTSYSQSGTLLAVPGDGVTNVIAILFSAPRIYQGGSFYGVVVFGDANGNGTNDLMGAVLQNNKNPQSVYPYTGAGYSNELSVIGGKYDKTKTLKQARPADSYSFDALSKPIPFLITYSEKDTNGTGRVVTTKVPSFEVPCTEWLDSSFALPLNTAGTSFSLPRGDLKKMAGLGSSGEPLYNYNSVTNTAVNPHGVTASYTKSSGIFKGSVSVYYDYPTVKDYTSGYEELSGWKHKVSKLSFAGVILHETADPSHVAYGYWLTTGKFPMSASKTYKFKQSGEIRILDPALVP